MTDKKLAEHEQNVSDCHGYIWYLWIYHKLDREYIDLKVSNAVFTMISVLHDTLSRRHVMQNSLLLCVHKCCAEMTLRHCLIYISS